MAQDDGRVMRTARGFTLLEVMVALAIAIPALLLIYRQGALSLQVTRSASRYSEAVSRAQSRLDALRGTALDAIDREGDEGNDFHWQTRVTPITTVQGQRGGGRAAYAGGTTLYAVTVEVSWPAHGRSVAGSQRVSLATRLAGPASGSSR